MKSLFKLVLACTVSFLAAAAYANAKSPTVVWTAVFSNFTPIKNTVSAQYCKSHTPSVIKTTIKQITSKAGVEGLNGVNIRYLSYRTVVKDNLYFNIVNAVVSGKNKNGKSWSLPMKLYEQTLSPIYLTNTVWSTPLCKGTFVGTPKVVK